MKPIKIKLIVTGFILATVIITAGIPASAQRRQTNREAQEPKDDKQIKSTVKQKSTFRDYDSSRRSSGNSSVKRNQEVRQKNAQVPTRAESRSNRSVQKTTTPDRQNEPGRVTTKPPQQRRETTTRSNAPVTRERTQAVPNSNRRNNSSSQRNSTVQPRQRTNNSGSANSRYDNSKRRSSIQNSGQATRRPNSGNRNNMYQLDKNDRRYSVNRNYKGNDQNWSGRYRSNNRHYNQFDRDYFRHYDYRKYNHWNHQWENYRWNYNSWIDYYNGYHPRSYMYHRNYYHHPVYGHVIRKFVHRPVIFVHNHHRYYDYDGHLFRFYRGVGYVLVDVPFGLVVEYLPAGYEQVYINGYLYFRVGNLFFENTDLGFRLVHYPERYYAYNDDFYNEGYYDDDLYY